MPLPTSRDVHVPGLLNDFAIEHGQDLSVDFAADAAATLISVDKQSDKYIVWDIGDIYRSVMALRTPGTKSEQGGIRIDTSNQYFADVYAMNSLITDEDKANADSVVMLEDAKVRWLMGQVKLKRDKLYADKVFKTGAWTSNTEQAGVSGSPGANQFKQFNDSASVPIKIITDQMLSIQSATGRMPNVGVCNPTVARNLIDHADFVARNTSSGMIPARVSIADVAAVLELDRIIVGRAVENTAAEGATDAITNVFGKHFLLLSLTPAMSKDEPTAVGGFVWKRFEGATSTGAAIRSWYEEDIQSTRYEVQDAYVPKITANELGVMLLDCVA